MTVYIISAVVFVWMMVLSVVVWKLKSHYYNLISTTKKEKLDDILDLLIDTDRRIEGKLDLFKKELDEEIKSSRLHVQKIGLVRFNPFERSGGEQSFVVSLLDRENTGIILNFIYTKDGLRVYTKRVKKGKGEEYELSEEENNAIERSS